jgi:hypothetical protein
MNYTFLRRGDRLPSAGVLQKLLNREGATLGADGIFGGHTESAVRAFQQSHHLIADGIVGQNTWPQVATGARLSIVDCIDVFDPSLMELEATDIERAGGQPILIGGACNGVEQIVTQVMMSASPGSVFLLRFHGHGAPGVAGISFGHGDIGYGERADIDLSNFHELQPVLARLGAAFGPYGNIQFMHCSTGGGANGRQLMKLIADATGVPVTAALQTQYGGGVATFKYEGPTFTAFPGGATLATWCASRPDFVPACFA